MASKYPLDRARIDSGGVQDRKGMLAWVGIKIQQETLCV